MSNNDDTVTALHRHVTEVAQATFAAFREVEVVITSGMPGHWTAKVIAVDEVDGRADFVVLDPATGEVTTWGTAIVARDGDDPRPVLRALLDRLPDPTRGGAR